VVGPLSRRAQRIAHRAQRCLGASDPRGKVPVACVTRGGAQVRRQASHFRERETEVGNEESQGATGLLGHRPEPHQLEGGVGDAIAGSGVGAATSARFVSHRAA